MGVYTKLDIEVPAVKLLNTTEHGITHRHPIAAVDSDCCNSDCCTWCICRPFQLLWVRCSRDEAAEECIGGVVNHDAFEPVIISLILVNAIFMAMPYGGQSGAS